MEAVSRSCFLLWVCGDNKPDNCSHPCTSSAQHLAAESWDPHFVHVRVFALSLPSANAVLTRHNIQTGVVFILHNKPHVHQSTAWHAELSCITQLLCNACIAMHAGEHADAAPRDKVHFDFLTNFD